MATFTTQTCSHPANPPHEPAAMLASMPSPLPSPTLVSMQAPMSSPTPVSIPSIDLNDLPAWCAQVAAMFRMDRPYGARSRRASVGEYEKHYAGCLRYCESLGASASFEAIRLFQGGLVRRGHESCLPDWGEPRRTVDFHDGRHSLDLNFFERAWNKRPMSPTASEDQSQPERFRPTVCISQNNRLHEMHLDTVLVRDADIMADAIAPEVAGCRTIVELGTGFGNNLHRLRERLPDVNLVGADASPNSLHLFRRLFSGDSSARCFEFDFYDPASYRFLDSLEPPIIVFTSGAIEQLPTAAPLFEGLSASRANIQRVYHLEPIYRPDDPGLLGLLRKRYIDTWDYTRDLMEQITTRSDIRLLDERPDAFGANPLNPLTLLKWEYTIDTPRGRAPDRKRRTFDQTRDLHGVRRP